MEDVVVEVVEQVVEDDIVPLLEIVLGWEAVREEENEVIPHGWRSEVLEDKLCQILIV